MPETLGDVGEFGLIDRIAALLETEGQCADGVTLGIGDDAASFRPKPGYDLLVTCDCAVEGRHWLPQYITAMDLGRRCMTLNISDIGAMGGHPRYALVSLGLRDDTPVQDVEAMYRGFLAELTPFGASIIGGNLTNSEGGIFIDITLIGEVESGRAVRRSTARAGDAILVTGYPGQAAAGLKLLLHVRDPEDLKGHPLVKAYNRPSHRAWEGEAVARTGCATAMIDTSDGFVGDLGHICTESGLGAELIQGHLPLSEDLRRAAEALGLDPHEMVLRDSDDYELIMTCSPAHVDQICSTVARTYDGPVSRVGRMTDSAGEIRLVRPDGSQRRLTASGWNHFGRSGGGI